MNSSLVQALLAFLLIVIAIPVALVTLRRVRLFNPASRQVLRLTGGIAIGPRERIAVVEVGGRWLVVGVTGQSINLLTTLDAAPGELTSLRPAPAGSAAAAGVSTDARTDATKSPVAAAAPLAAGGFAGLLAAVSGREAG